MSKREVVERMCASGVCPVFRTSDVRHLMTASRAIHAGGIGCIEYTMTMPNALDLIRRGVGELPEDSCFGAGTVTDGKTVEAAVKAGARFIASPGISAPMVKACRDNGVASVVGAMTPSEIITALDLGADIIKVFCAASVGPVFFENMLGPFPGICMMAAGGVTLKNLKDYIHAGAEIVTYVPNLIDPAAYAAGEAAPLIRTAATYVEAVSAARRSRK